MAFQDLDEQKDARLEAAPAPSQNQAMASRLAGLINQMGTSAPTAAEVVKLKAELEVVREYLAGLGA